MVVYVYSTQKWGFIPMRYFFGFLITIGLLFFVIILIMRGGGNDTQVTTRTLASYASTGSEVSFLNDGRINAASLHTQVLITVDAEKVTYRQLVGYDGHVVATRHFANTQNAYSAFLSGLANVGFAIGLGEEGSTASEKGVCPLGQRYIFEMNEGSKQILRSWSTSCGTHTYKGNASSTIQLFQAQVPGYQELTQNVQF